MALGSALTLGDALGFALGSALTLVDALGSGVGALVVGLLGGLLGGLMNPFNNNPIVPLSVNRIIMMMMMMMVLLYQHVILSTHGDSDAAEIDTRFPDCALSAL